MRRAQAQAAAAAACSGGAGWDGLGEWSEAGEEASRRDGGTSEQSEGNIRYFYGTNMTLTGGPEIVYAVSYFFLRNTFRYKTAY